MSINRTTTKIATLIAILSIAGFFIYKGVAGPMKINMPDTNRLTSGLVGYWTFDGQDTNWGTNTTNDRSGNGYNGTMTNMSTTTSPVPGVAGQALNFDGSDDYVDVGAGSSITFDRYTPFSASVWVKRGNLTANNYYSIMGDYDNSVDTGWFLRFEGGNAVGLAFIGSQVVVNSTVTNNTSFTSTTNWYHIVATYDGSNTASGMKIYVDGANANVTPVSGTGNSFANSTSGIIGKGKFNGSNNLLFNGSIDEVRIYNRALSASEITELYQQGQTKINASQANKLTSGLVGYWTFDGQDTNWGTNTTNDRSGNGYNGTMTNMSTTTSPVPGVAGQALNFDGSASYVDTNQSDGFNITGNITISAWINKRSGGSALQFIASKYDMSDFTGPWMLRTGQNDGLLFFAGGWDDGQISQSTFSNNQWHHVVVVRNSQTVKVTFYIDGVQDSGGWQPYNGSAVDTNNLSAKIGRKTNIAGSSNSFNGLIDEVRIYNRAISASEVSELYNQGQTKINASQTNKLTSGLVLYQSFDGNHMDWSQTTAEARDQNPTATKNNGDVVGNTSATIGKIGQALSFDGNDDYVNMGNVSALNFDRTNSFSGSAWVKRGAAGGYQRIAGKAEDCPRGWFYALFLDKLRFALLDNICSNAIYKETVATYTSLTDWYHFAFTYDGSSSVDGMKLYVNGSEITNVITVGTTLSTYITTSASAAIGIRASDLAHDFNGLIDEVRVYNRALSASEVQELYNQGR